MPSEALRQLRAALGEVTDLGRAARSSLIAATGASLRLVRAVGRARVVLLSSHFERYLYAVNEEAVLFLNDQRVAASALPEILKLLHSKSLIDEMAETGWERRSEKLVNFISGDGWLWSTAGAGTLSHERLLAWMTAPKPDSLLRYYRYWGINDIFGAVTRTPFARSKLWLGVQELVDQRNKIAHGDLTAQATQADIQRYVESVRTFCKRADRQLARALASFAGSAKPW